MWMAVSILWSLVTSHPFQSTEYVGTVVRYEVDCGLCLNELRQTRDGKAA